VRLFAGERVHRQQHLRARERRWKKVHERREKRKETTEPEAIGESAEKVVEKEEERKKKK
jgi:hypothetical protein